MPASSSWCGHLVVATPAMRDERFARSVIVLLQHDDQDGSLGVVLNRATMTGLHEVLPGWAALAAGPASVFQGGPVAPTSAICLGLSRLGVVASGAFSPVEAVPMLGTVDLGVEPRSVEPLVSQIRVFAGYAGWTRGQLEGEVARGAWWVLDALPGDPFSARPDLLWAQVLRRQGPPLAFAAHYPPDPALN